MASPISEMNDRIAALREEIQELLEKEPVDLEGGDTSIVEQLTQRNEELEKLAKERDLLKRSEQIGTDNENSL